MSEPARLVRKDGTVAETHGASGHGPDCSCARCRGFERGHTLSQRHGAYAVVSLSPRASEVAAALTDALREEGLYRPAFAVTVDAASLVLVRLERAAQALTAEEERHAAGDPDADPDKLSKLKQDANRWATNARGWLSDLGLSPASMARISKDAGIAKASRASAALRELDAHLEGRYPEETDGEVEA